MFKYCTYFVHVLPTLAILRSFLTVKHWLFLDLQVFGNQITAGSGIGTMVVICGVFVYNKAQGISKTEEEEPKLPICDDARGRHRSND